MIEKQYKEQRLQSEKNPKTSHMVEGLRMGTQKKECQTDSFEELLKQLVCRFAY